MPIPIVVDLCLHKLAKILKITPNWIVHNTWILTKSFIIDIIPKGYNLAIVFILLLPNNLWAYETTCYRFI